MRQQRRIQTSFWSAMSIAGLLLAGCGGDSGDSDDGSQPLGNENGELENGADGGDDGSEADEESPLAEYMGPGFGFSGMTVMAGSAFDDGGMSEEERQNFRQIQESVADCMRDEGFEYVPESIDELESSMDSFDEAYALAPEEFARQYGYGISTMMFEPDDEDDDNPNTAIRDGLSESAGEAYDQALWGDMAAQLDASGSDEVLTEPGEFENMDLGCQGRAAEEIFEDGDQEIGSFEHGDEFDSLHQDIFALQDRIRRDPRVEAAVADWQHCMADGGYPDFEHPDQAQESVFDRMLDLYAENDGSDGQTTSSSSEIVVGGPGSDVDPEKLAELQEYELDVAVVDFACQQEHYQEVYRDVAWAMEQEFIDANRDELERYRDWLAEGGGPQG